MNNGFPSRATGDSLTQLCSQPAATPPPSHVGLCESTKVRKSCSLSWNKETTGGTAWWLSNTTWAGELFPATRYWRMDRWLTWHGLEFKQVSDISTGPSGIAWPKWEWHRTVFYGCSCVHETWSILLYSRILWRLKKEKKIRDILPAKSVAI